MHESYSKQILGTFSFRISFANRKEKLNTRDAPKLTIYCFVLLFKEEKIKNKMYKYLLDTEFFLTF